jgi:hypothetical protein
MHQDTYFLTRYQADGCRQLAQVCGKEVVSGAMQQPREGATSLLPIDRTSS